MWSQCNSALMSRQLQCLMWTAKSDCCSVSWWNECMQPFLKEKTIASMYDLFTSSYCQWWNDF